MALQGTLDTFTLADVLRFLAATAKTGRLRVDGDRSAGSVWLDGGAIVSGEVGAVTAPDTEVIFALLRNREGGFEFGADDRAPVGHDPVIVDEVVVEAEAMLGSWQAIESVVSSLDLRVTLARELVGDETIISREQWRWLVAVGEGRTVAELATAMGLGEIGGSTMVKALYDADLIEIDEPGSDIDQTPLAGSTEVGLDATLEAPLDHHAYLSAGANGSKDPGTDSVLPEPLPSEDAVPPQLSPEAAKAIAAAAGTDPRRNGRADKPKKPAGSSG